MTVADQLVEEDNPLDHVEIRQVLRPLLADLGERERTVLQMRFIDNRTQSEIAEALGISQVHVSRLLSKTLGQLKHRLDDDSRPG
jgi:RNA polymerase sigma-B factor